MIYFIKDQMRLIRGYSEAVFFFYYYHYYFCLCDITAQFNQIVTNVKLLL